MSTFSLRLFLILKKLVLSGAGAGKSIPAKENGISLASNKAGSVLCSPVVQEINKKDDGRSFFYLNYFSLCSYSHHSHMIILVRHFIVLGLNV